MVITRPKGLNLGHYPPEVDFVDLAHPVFVIHPSTSVLAESLVIDPKALDNENYSGIYDAGSDYIPQYCDDPMDIPQGSVIPANPGASDAPGNAGGTEGPSDTPPPSGNTPPNDGDNK